MDRVIFVAWSLFIFLLLGFSAKELIVGTESRKNIIAHGCAEYDRTSGEFVWLKESTK